MRDTTPSEPRGDAAGSPRSRATRPASGGDSERRADAALGTDPGHGGGPTGAAWEAEALAELERLRAELATERARGRARALELETVVRDLRRLLALPREEREPNPAPAVARASGAPARLGVALAAAGVLGFVLRPLVLPGAPRPALAAERSAPAGSGVLGHVSPPAAPGHAVAVPDRPEASAQPVAEPASAEQASAEPASAEQASAEPASAEQASAEAAASEAAPRRDDDALEVPADPRPERAPDAGPGAALAADAGQSDPTTNPVAERTPVAPVPDSSVSSDEHDPFRAAAFVGRWSASAAAPLAYAPLEAPPCTFHAELSADPRLRDAVGPCMGPPTQDGHAVAGTHRVDGVPCRRHHQLAQRLGGDRAQLIAVAENARQDGVLPPLVAARVDRAAGLFLRARFGAWAAAGVDDLGGLDHRVTLAADGVAHVDTWIELERRGEVEPRRERRRLTLAIELGDGPAGDTLLELRVVADRAADAPATSAGG